MITKETQLKIEIPANCPSCGSSLELVNSQLFCRNKTTCPAQSSKLLENFCSKLKLKGFGPKTLEKLGITSIPELWYLTSKDLNLAVGDKVGTKLNLELESKLRTAVLFQDVLSSLGIPLLGDVAARKLAVNFNSFKGITAEGKLGESLASWLASDMGKEVVALPWTFVHKSATPASKSLGIEVCITGVLKDFKNRRDAKEYLTNLGVSVKDNMVKSVSYLICEDDTKKTSASYKKAEQNGTPILTIKELLEKIYNV